MTSPRSRLAAVATWNGGNIRRKLQNATIEADPTPSVGNAQLDNEIPTPTSTTATAKPIPQPTPLSNLNFPSASPSPYVEGGSYPATSGNSIPFYPTHPSNSYPTFPSNSYPSYPTFPSNSYPSYPSNSYPTYPSNSYPSYPSNSYPTYNEDDGSMPAGFIALVVFAVVVGGFFSFYRLLAVSKPTDTPTRTQQAHRNAMPVNGSTSTARPATVAAANARPAQENNAGVIAVEISVAGDW